MDPLLCVYIGYNPNKDIALIKLNCDFCDNRNKTKNTNKNKNKNKSDIATSSSATATVTEEKNESNVIKSKLKFDKVVCNSGNIPFDDDVKINNMVTDQDSLNCFCVSNKQSKHILVCTAKGYNVIDFNKKTLLFDENRKEIMPSPNWLLFDQGKCLCFLTQRSVKHMMMVLIYY